MLAAWTLTRTCPAPMSGNATSFSGMLSMLSYCSTTTAFMRIPDPVAKYRRVGKGALAPCPPSVLYSRWWARFALRTLRFCWPTSADAPLAVLPERLSQLALQDLAGAGERQRLVADLDAARAFVAGDQRLAELHQFVRHGLRAGLGHHGGVDLLTPALAGDADHVALRYRRVLRQRVLDFGGIDVLAAGDDHVLDAVDHIDEAILVHVAAVAGVHPAVDNGLGGLLRPFPIAYHH